MRALALGMAAVTKAPQPPSVKTLSVMSTESPFEPILALSIAGAIGTGVLGGRMKILRDALVTFPKLPLGEADALSSRM
jgi:hypothetical protein